MISKNHIDRAIYHASKDIVCRRYNPLAGIVLTIVGAALLWANYHVSYFDERELLAQWNLLLSSCLLLTGLTMICYRLFGDSSAPVERATGFTAASTSSRPASSRASARRSRRVIFP